MRRDPKPKKTNRNAAARSKHVEEAVPESRRLREKEWERTFDAVPDLIAIVDTEHRMLRVNRAMAERLGMTAEQCAGLACYRCVHGLDEPPAFCPHVQTLADGQEHTAEVYEERLGGHFLITCTPLFDDQGRMIGSVHVARDITERKRTEETLREANARLQVQAEELTTANEELRDGEEALRESESRFRAIFESTQDAIVIVDDEGTCVQANPTVEAIFGLSPEQLIGRSVSDFFSEAVHFPTLWRDFRANGSFHGEMPMTRADGQVRYVDAYAVANILPGRHLSVIRDITERKRAQEALQEVNEQLQQQAEELQTQTEELRVANEELRANEQALRESEERYRSLFENMLDGCAYCQMLFDGQGRPVDFVYLSVNDAFSKLTSLQNVVGKKVTEVIPGIRQSHPELLETYGRVAMTGRPERFEIDFKPLGMWLSIAVYSPRKGYFTAVFDDITERKQAEEALRESEERYHQLFEDDLTGDFISTPDGQVLLCNPAFAQIFGFASVQDAVRANIVDLYIDANDRQPLLERLKQQGKIERLEVWRKRHDGEPIYVVENLVGHFNERGELYEIKGYIFDDTERKHAEEALRSVALFPEQNPAPTLRVARDGTLLYANGASAFLLRSWDCRPGQAAPERIRQYVVQALDSQEITEADVVCDLITYSFSIAPVASEGYANLYARDITERKRAEEALRESRERLERTQEIAHLGSWELDLVNNRLTWSDEVYRIFGLQPQEFGATYEAFLNHVHPEDRAAVDAAYSGSLREGRDTYEIEHRIVRRSTGEVRIVHEKCDHLRDAAGRIIRSVGMVHDITERKRAEEATRESEAALQRSHKELERSVQERTADLDAMTRLRELGALFVREGNLGSVLDEIIDAAMAISGADSGTIQLLGPTSSTLKTVRQRGLPEWWLDLWDNIPGGRGTCGTALARGERVIVEDVEQSPIFVGTPDLEIHRKAGVRAVQSTPLVSRSGKPLGMFSTHYRTPHRPDDRTLRLLDLLARQAADIIERAQTEETLREFTRTLETRVAERTAELQYRARQLQKLALELSETEDRERKRLAEVLHDDLQQQLAAAKFHLQMLGNRLRHDPSRQAIAVKVDQMLKEAVEKSRSLSHELSPAVLYHGNLAETFTWLAGQIQAKHGLIVHVDTFSEVPVQSDALKAFLYKAGQELLFNVVKHARVNEARIRLRRVGRCICVSVSDHGRGFDPQELRQTAGFGLLSIRERIELLGGRMKIKSAKGQGSTFHIVVPDDGASLVARRSSLAATDRRAISDERPPLRVLLADDHQIVREGLVSLLVEMPGIEVVGEAANGREAINLAGKLRPDVVIMDVAMPLINGDEATRQIKMHLPGTRVIALSMYDEPDLIEKMQQAGAEGYVLKTAPSEELLAAIRGR